MVSAQGGDMPDDSIVTGQIELASALARRDAEARNTLAHVPDWQVPAVEAPKEDR